MTLELITGTFGRANVRADFDLKVPRTKEPGGGILPTNDVTEWLRSCWLDEIEGTPWDFGGK